MRALPLLLGLALAGTTLGLFISAISPSERVAITLIPIAVIPQIILSGAIAKLTGLADILGHSFVATFWGKRGMDALLTDQASKFAREEHIKLTDANGTTFPLILILAHAAVFAILTVAALSTDGSIGGIAAKIKAWSGWLFSFGGRRPTSGSSSSV